MESRTIYRPSVCHQADGIHTHYNIILIKHPSPDTTNEDLLRKLAGKVGGRTAGQVIERLLEKREYLYRYGIDYIKVETLPTYQICHKGENESPAVDWDVRLFSPYVDAPPPPPGNPQVGRIRHR